MAKCSKCGTDVDCSCKLIQGLCVTCYYKNTSSVTNTSTGVTINLGEKKDRINTILDNAISNLKNDTQ